MLRRRNETKLSTTTPHIELNQTQNQIKTKYKQNVKLPLAKKRISNEKPTTK